MISYLKCWQSVIRNNTGVVYCIKVCSSVQYKSNLRLLQFSNSQVSAHENRIWLRGGFLKAVPSSAGVQGIRQSPSKGVMGCLRKTQFYLGLCPALSILTRIYFPLHLMENIAGNWPACLLVSKPNSGMGFRASEEIQPSLQEGLPSMAPA